MAITGIVSPDGGGHFTVPDEAMRSLETALLEFSGMREVSTVVVVPLPKERRSV